MSLGAQACAFMTVRELESSGWRVLVHPGLRGQGIAAASLEQSPWMPKARGDTHHKGKDIEK